MQSGVIPQRGLSMETIAGVFFAIARGLRGLFDLACMAVGVAPTSGGIVSTATVGTAGAESSNVEEETGLPSWAFQPAESYEYSDTFKRDIGLSLD
jgi:hypothetical protein